ncbi:hypothetical protein [Rothia nasimurium]|uniref:hypothetical protein n=1 Tax=Rothia nasimurium TaxID=85336 RepID=UPI0015D82D1F|nr:hypothetical protein [Rothia nasimurium]
MPHKKLTSTDISGILGDAAFADHQAEAEERYVGADDWAISQQRTASWSQADWGGQQGRLYSRLQQTRGYRAPRPANLQHRDRDPRHRGGPDEPRLGLAPDPPLTERASYR